MKRHSLLLALVFMLFVSISYSCKEDDPTTDDTEEVEEEQEEQEEEEEENTTPDSTVSFTGEGLGIGELEYDNGTCSYNYTIRSSTDSLQLALDYKDGEVVSGTYALAISTQLFYESGDVSCFPDALNDSFSGSLIVFEEALSFQVNLGANEITYSFVGTVINGQIEGMVTEASPRLTSNIQYEIMLDK